MRCRRHCLSCFLWLYYLYVLLLLNCPRFSQAECNGLMPSEKERCACINQGLVFNCTINGTGITEWNGTFINCSNGLLLRHSRFMDGTMVNCGQIAARSIGVDNGCYSSQLTATATAALNNTSVWCVRNFNEEQTIIGTVSLTVISGPPEQPHISVYVRQGELVFSWQPNIPICSLMEYNIISNNCGSCVLDGTSATCSNLTLSTVASVCSFSVSSMACGFSGTPSNFEVTVKVPDIPMVQALLPVYTYDSDVQRLTGITINISQEIPFNLTNNISGSVQRYNFSFSPTTTPMIITTSCEDQVCEYHINNISTSLCSRLTSFNIFVAAANAIGLGQPSQPFNIGCTNQFVEVMYNPNTAIVACSFFSNANYSCSIEYRLCQDTEVESSTKRSNTTGSNEVLLQIQPAGSAEHCYVIIASNDTFAVIVKGTFNVTSGSVTNTAVILGVVIPTIFALVLVVATAVIVMIRCLKRSAEYKDTHDTVSESHAGDNEAENDTSKKELKDQVESQFCTSNVAADTEHSDGGNSDHRSQTNQRDPTYIETIGGYVAGGAAAGVAAVGAVCGYVMGSTTTPD